VSLVSALLALSSRQVQASAGVVIQQGNAFPQTEFRIQPSPQLADNRIGAMWETRHINVGDICDLGLKWARIWCYDFAERAEEQAEGYSISAEDDRIVTTLADAKVTMMYVFGPSLVGGGFTFRTVQEVERYLRAVRFIVRHFKDRIRYYELWNEPEGNIALPDYIKLVQRTVPVIRQECPEAKIVVGAVSYLRFQHCREWLKGLVSSEVMPLVDGVSWHGMYGTAPSGDPRGKGIPGGNVDTPDYYENYPALIQEIKELASAAGFKGEYLVEEMIWRTQAEPLPAEPWTYSDTAAAKYLARAIILHLGLNVRTGIAIRGPDDPGLRRVVVRNLCTAMTGARPGPLSVDIRSKKEENIAHYAFSLPNGDRLLALWNDGVASEDDPGVITDLTFRGGSAARVTAIDILNGVQQPLQTTTQGNDLVVRSIRLRDYPLLLRLVHKH